MLDRLTENLLKRAFDPLVRTGQLEVIAPSGKALMFGDGGQPLVHGRLGDIDHDDADARNGAGLRDAIAHGACAHDADGGDVHRVFQ